MAPPFNFKKFRQTASGSGRVQRLARGSIGLPELVGQATARLLENRHLTRLGLTGRPPLAAEHAIQRIHQRLARVHAAVSQGEPVYEVLLVNEGEQVDLARATLARAQRTYRAEASDELEQAAPAPGLLPSGEPALLAPGRAYLAVVVPTLSSVPRYLARLLMRYQAMGGPVILLGEPPQLLDGKPNTTMTRFFDTLPRVSPRGLAPLLRVMAPPRLRVYGPDDDDRRNLRVAMYELGKGQTLLHLGNLDAERSFNVDVIAAGQYSHATVLDPDSGEAIPLRTQALEGDFRGALLFQLPLASWQDHLVLLSPVPISPAKPVSLLPHPVSERAELLPEAWTIGTPARNGTVYYTAVLPPLAGKGWFVELGQLDMAVAEMTINDEPVGSFLMEPFEVPVPAWARKGQRLEITVSPLPGAAAPDVSPIRFIKR